MSDRGIVLDTLGEYLDSDLSPVDCLGLSDLDGFLTAIVIGPELIMPGEWLPAVWGGDEPEFESESQMRTVIGQIMGRYNEIATGFIADPAVFEPIFMKWPTGEVIVTDWAAGFLDGVGVRRAAWEPLFAHRRAKVLLEPLLILGDDEDFESDEEFPEKKKEFYAAAPNVVPTCVWGIHDFWKDWRDRRTPRPRRARGSRR